jgi:ubiquinone/menaquinone biosynthesis C-methylase UbiE
MERQTSDVRRDRYKASSLRTYNKKWPGSYDSCIYWKVYPAEKWDRAVIEHCPADISSTDILDVGCASGRLLESLARAGATRLAGVELAPKMLDFARSRLNSAGYSADMKVADAEDYLPWPDQSFDMVALTGVLHHFYRPTDALGEIHRVLRTGGRLIILEPYFPPPIRQIINLFLRIKPVNGDCRFYTHRGVERLLVEKGFTVPESRFLGWYSYLSVGERL